MKFYFHARAEEEFDEAVAYYENCQSGLGLEFAEEIYASVQRIAAYPDAWAEMSKRTRRCIVNRFPYGIIFQVKANALRIIAVANLHQRPGYWKDRL